VRCCSSLMSRESTGTPKPLVAIVTSAALRQARGIASEESGIGSENSEAMFGGDLLSSTGFSRGWFDSGLMTPQEASGIELDCQCGACVHYSGIVQPPLHDSWAAHVLTAQIPFQQALLCSQQLTLPQAWPR